MRVMTPEQEELLNKLVDLAYGDLSLVERALDESDNLEAVIAYIVSHRELPKKVAS